MTDDLVKRLRSYAKDQGGWCNIDDTCEEAADEIERLRSVLDAITKGAKKTLIECEKLDNWNGYGEGYNYMAEWVEKIVEVGQ